jgi:UDP-N-acetylmuramate--alanine ligase
MKSTPKMNRKMNKRKIIISGGGTGGHIFPALSIANAIKKRYPDAEILFAGALGRMEMEKVPAAGYKIIGLPVAGFNRKNLLKNIVVLWKLYQSITIARKIIRYFKPDIAIGVGGYASGPILKAASQKGVPTLLQEQNSYAGITNKLLAQKAAKICVAYEGMEKFFPKDKIVLTGNPVRELKIENEKLKMAYEYFNFSPNKKTLLIIGGSLGAHTINKSLLAGIDKLLQAGIQVIWQTGKYYYKEMNEKINFQFSTFNFQLVEFISRMDFAYAIADLVVSRAGAGSISEFCLLGKPVILVPSPNVAEDHQTKNAMALVKKDAAVLVRDIEAHEKLVNTALELINDKEKLKSLSDNILKLALPDSADKIVDEIEKVLNFQFSNLYFIGAGGIGMSNLARFFLSEKKSIAGYDKVESALTQQLNAEGAQIHYEDNVDLIPETFKNKENTLVVYTPAVPHDHSELTFFRENGFRLMKRAQVLGEITKTKRGVCVAGTHGKTTTSSMIAHLLKQSHVDCNAFLGGILKNYDNNLLLSEKSDLTVIEADEYDRSFHWLTPYMAVITSVAPDHLDIYGTEKAYREAFEKFASLVRENGTLLLEAGVEINLTLQAGVKVFRYSGNLNDFKEKPDFSADNIRIANGEIIFDFIAPDAIVKDISLGVPVEINITNAVAALAIAYLNGVTPDELRNGMASFQGAKRRFDFHIKTGKLVLIDDYAHHPEELEASISSVRKLYPDRKLTVVFQPHLYSRTNDFFKEFAKSLSLCDEVILIPIYPAREEPIPGVSSQMILDLVDVPNKKLVAYDELVNTINKDEIEVLLMAGAGDIELLVEPVKNKLLC